MERRQRSLVISALVLGLGSSVWAALAQSQGGAASAASKTPAAPAAKAADPLADQLRAGAAVYAASCQGCHGDKLQGVRGPALVGDEIHKEFTGAEHPYADLYAKVSKTMPRSAPASLKEQQYLDVVAFVFAQNGVALPSGGLSAKTLKDPALMPTPRALQVKAGAAVYAASCQGCHGDKLQGVRGPALLGAAFVDKWNTVGDLHAKVAKTMPRNAPASLKEGQYLEVLAFLLGQNKVAGADTALTDKDMATKLK